jgi:predicted N-acetyltransferase YhbS
LGKLGPPGAGRPPYSAPRPISADDRLDDFDCGKTALNDFLRRRALKNEGRASRTFVVCSTSGEVVAYYTVSAGAVELHEAPPKLRRNMPSPLPVMVLGRLATDVRHGGRGIGKAMLREALSRVLEASRSVGVRAVLVHAIDDEAIAFYAQFGFQAFPADSRTLFLPVETIETALA